MDWTTIDHVRYKGILVDGIIYSFLKHNRANEIVRLFAG
jgi:hypothetical protein